MRSEVVHRALLNIPNRFSLCQTVSQATRTLHVGQTRTEDTMNAALVGVGDGRYKVTHPELKEREITVV